MLATIDVGTNTALLLVAEVEDGRLVSRFEAERFVRLGAGVDASGTIQEAALLRLRDALLAYREVAAEWGADEVVVAGTSASRDARNRDDLKAFVRRETGLDYEILTGEEEAAWTFVGALSAFDDLEGTCAVLDVGGGSTEIVVGTAGSAGPTYRCSVDAGSVRLTERFFTAQPPRPDEVEAASDFAVRLFDRAAPPLDAGTTLVGTAGTVMALARLAGGTTAFAPVLDARTVRSWRERLLAMPCDEVLALDPAVMTGRADVFAAGVLLLDLFMAHFGLAACRVSPRSLRHGLAIRAMRRRAERGERQG